MTTLRHVGRSQATGLEVYTLSLAGPAAVPQSIFMPSPKFTCLLAWNAAGLSVDVISQVLEKLLQLGCVYLCCWGQDCERVHDIADEIIVGDGNVECAGIMTTWHAEPIEEAVDFFLDLASSDDPECSTAVLVSIGGTATNWWPAIRGPRNASTCHYHPGAL